MPFNQKPQKFNAKINTVTVGTGDKAVTIGGENYISISIPLMHQQKTAPKIGVEISDLGLG